MGQDHPLPCQRIADRATYYGGSDFQFKSLPPRLELNHDCISLSEGQDSEVEPPCLYSESAALRGTDRSRAVVELEVTVTCGQMPQYTCLQDRNGLPGRAGKPAREEKELLQWPTRT